MLFRLMTLDDLDSLSCCNLKFCCISSPSTSKMFTSMWIFSSSQGT